MPKDGVTFKLDGADEIRRLFRETPKAITEKAVRESARPAMTKVLRSAKKILRQERGGMTSATGLLEKSLAVKVKLYKRGRNAGVVWAGVGVRSNKQVVTRRVRVGGKIYDYQEYANPAFYAHLVEFGGRHRSGGTRRAVPFLRKAFAQHKQSIGSDYVRMLKAKVPQIIKREANRARVKTK